MPNIEVEIKRNNIEVVTGGRVLSVAGRTGAVTLTLADIIGLETALGSLTTTSISGKFRNFCITRES